MRANRFNAVACVAVGVLLVLTSGCAARSGHARLPLSHPVAATPSGPFVANERELADILQRHGVITAGIGVIRNGELVWDRYFGEQSPGVPATAATRFNVASITKTVTAETILRLVGAGRLSLDEPMAAAWVDPDVADDPRHRLLTPRMALNHTTGLPNWRFFLRSGKLEFLHRPGERFGYSGEGIEYLARFAERKLGKPFPALVSELLFDPLGMTRTSITVDTATNAPIARAVDAEGVFHGYYCRPEGKGWCRKAGSYSAADDMVTTVRDYAMFLRAVMDAEGYPPAIAAERDRVQSDKGDQRVVDCQAVAASACPHRQGYGLGFNVLDFGDTVVVGHGGEDWAELALAYFSTPARSGLIVFLNVPTRRGLAAMPELLERLDPASPFLAEYRRWLALAKARDAATR
jgi:CubicO group peptidase (beta-lactamase class C family)